MNSRTASLICHPSTRTDAVRAIAVTLGPRERGGLDLAFVLEGNLARLRVPAPHRPQVDDRLWQHTCFELFVAAADTRAYHELNFSPSGEWATFAFRDYRDGGPIAGAALAPRIVARSSADRLELDAAVALDGLSTAYAGAALRVGLSAVVEETNGNLSYWALRHPPGKADFHHPDCFALRLETIA